jgi:hypothetical protein
MKRLTIPKKQSGTGSIHDIASDQLDRIIDFRSGYYYAVVPASHYRGMSHTVHQTGQAAIKKSHELKDYSHKIIDSDGNEYTDNDGLLCNARDGRPAPDWQPRKKSGAKRKYPTDYTRVLVAVSPAIRAKAQELSDDGTLANGLARLIETACS